MRGFWFINKNYANDNNSDNDDNDNMNNENGYYNDITRKILVIV